MDLKLDVDKAINNLAVKNAKLAIELSVAEAKIEQLIAYISELEEKN